MNLELLKDFTHHLMGARQTQSMYPPEHPRVAEANRAVFMQVTQILELRPEIKIALADGELVVDDRPVPADGDLLDGFARLLQRQGVGKVVIRKGVRRWELSTLIRGLATVAEEVAASGGIRALLEVEGVQNITAGPITIGEGPEDDAFDALAEAWELYVSGLDTVRQLRSGVADGLDPDALDRASGFAESMVGMVDENPEIFLRLQALKSHDDYSFTHSLNVALMSLSIARQMEIPTEAMMEVAMAALLHDIGKELVPDEVLNKPGKLTDEEWVIMQRHNSDGSRLLLQQDPIHDLAVIVAYEHQLAYEFDNPDHGRWPLHFVSELVCIADVYDALRSNRPYRAAMPPDRAMRIMEEEAPKKFDQELFEGFLRMLGYYPPGTVVRLTDGSIAVAEKANPDDKERPLVVVIRSADGRDLEPPRPLDLYRDPSVAVAEVVDGDAIGIDPFDYVAA